MLNKAQEAVKRTQEYDEYPVASGSSSMPKAVTKPASPPAQATSSRPFASAQKEKETMRLYQEATDRVNQTVNGEVPIDAGAVVSGLGGPVAYEQLYPSAVKSASPPPAAHAYQAPSDLPPPFEAGAPKNAKEQLDEKERMRQNYERRDAEELTKRQQVNAGSSSGSHSYDPPPFPSGPSPSDVGEAISEKEILRRRFAQQDREAMGVPSYTPVSPSRHVSVSAVPSYSPSPPPRRQVSTSGSLMPHNVRASRPTPLPPVGPGGFKPLTAAEEKATLKARYDAENNAAGSTYYQASPPATPPYMNGRGSAHTPPLHRDSSSTGASVPTPKTPPPLAPRPPPSYIAETQAEDARVSAYALTGTLPSDAGGAATVGLIHMNGSVFKAPGPPPPLPPKPADDI